MDYITIVSQKVTYARTNLNLLWLTQKSGTRYYSRLFRRQSYYTYALSVGQEPFIWENQVIGIYR